MRTHTEIGGRMLSLNSSPYLAMAADIARAHHEHWDGTGQWGLTGAAIPDEAQVVGLCDAFDALCHARPWRLAYSLPDALRMLEAEACHRFRPDLVRALVELVKREFWAHSDFFDFLAEEAAANSYVKARAHIDRLLGTHQ